MSDEFISSSRKDIEFAQRIHHELEARAHEPWLDWQDILDGHIYFASGSHVYSYQLRLC